VSTHSIPSDRLLPAGVPPGVGHRQPRVVLTRRGRLVVFLSGLAALMATAVSIGDDSAATDTSSQEPAAVRVVMIEDGDTLWSIAADIADDGDVPAMVSRILELNSLENAAVEVGQRVRVPRELPD
jgi:hypothetical protein